jgi:hypothetical protein
MSGMIGHGHKHPRAPENKHLSRCSGTAPRRAQWRSGFSSERQGGQRAREEVVWASGAHYAVVRRHSSEGRGNGGDGGSEALRAVARSGRC